MHLPIKQKKSWLSPVLNFLLLVLLLALPRLTLAQSYFEITPYLYFTEEYDDNLFLNPTNEESAYITTVSPGLSLSLIKQNTQLELEYLPTFVWYSESDIDSNVRHSGTLTFAQSLAEHLRFDLSDTVLRSDDPLEDTEDVEGIRTTREQYLRNTGRASLSYLFGPENMLTVGYEHSYLKNDDDTEDDGRTQNPFVNMTYRINEKNRVALDYGYVKADFWRDDGSAADDDYTGHEPGIRYLHSFTPHTTGSLGYRLATRRFDQNFAFEDYEVHEGLLGFEHAFSSDLTASAGAGYFIQVRDHSDDETGFVYNASASRQFERGVILIGGSGGYDEAYLEPESRGFTRYWSVNTSAEYQILEPLTLYAGGSYRHDKDGDNQEWETSRGNCGLRWEFLRWFFLSLDYTYAERDDDVDADDYRVNRVSLILTASRLYRW